MAKHYGVVFRVAIQLGEAAAGQVALYIVVVSYKRSGNGCSELLKIFFYTKIHVSAKQGFGQG